MPEISTIRMLVAEDHPLFRKGMIALLSSVPEFEVVGEAATGEEAVTRAAEVRPYVVLMDLQMPEVKGWVSGIRLEISGIAVINSSSCPRSRQGACTAFWHPPGPCPLL